MKTTPKRHRYLSFGWRKTNKFVIRPNIAISSSLQQRRIRIRKVLNMRMKKLKTEMEEISKDQKSIRAGQIEVKQKFEAIETDCRQLRRETRVVAQQTITTKLRLALMFQILKAREDNDLDRATHLTRILRELMTGNRQV